MKKISLVALALVMMFSLAACSEKVTLVDITTPHGVSMKVPSDLSKLSDVSYANTKTGDTVALGIGDVGDVPLSEWTEENVQATYASSYKDVVVNSFSNSAEIDGKAALVSTVSFTTPGGNALVSTLVMITTGETNYVVSLSWGKNNSSGSLAKNLEACINSIKIK